MTYPAKREWLRAIRKDKGLTQTDVSKATGISLAYYQRIEYGQRNPSLAVARKLSALLGFPMEMLAADADAFKHREVIVAQTE